MRIESTLTVRDAPGALWRALACEDEGGVKNDRSRTTIRKKGKDIVCTIDASDATAFRACANSLAKLLMTFEKMEDVPR